MTLVLAALAIGVLWWPAARAEIRLAWLADTGRSPRRRSWRWFAIGAAPAVALVVLPVAAAVSTGMVVAALTWRWRRRSRDRRRATESADLLRALAVMIAELSVGAPPAHACTSAARELGARSDSAVARGLATMAGRAELGGDVVPDADGIDTTSAVSWQRIGVAWQMADRHGLPMVELLESVRADLLARRQFADRTRAGLAGPRATAAVLAGLPAVGVALGELIGAHPLGILLGTRAGGALLVVGTALALAGLAWSDRIVDRVVNG